MENNIICFKETRKKFEEYLLALGYSKGTVEWYQGYLSRLEKFMSAFGETMYSTGTGASFLKKQWDAGQRTRSMKNTRLAIRRLDDFVKGKHCFAASKDHFIPDCFSKDFNAYIENLRLVGRRESTIKRMYYDCLKILEDFHAAHVYSLSEIKPQDIYRVFSKSANKINLGGTLRSFLRYLFQSGILINDLSVIVPSVRHRQPIPSVYTKTETRQLLSCIDTGKNPGRRDYVIILFALKLGIRSGDIVNLKISNLDFESDVIEFNQSKTAAPQQLAFLPELKDAIKLYLIQGRPETNCPNLFITHRAPFRPLSVSAVTMLITRHMKNSGIIAGSRKRGGHALRMTLASELISEKTPYEAVRKILGHEDAKSMKHYVKFDIEMLRSCAIEIPPLSGLLSEYINKQEGGKKR